MNKTSEKQLALNRAYQAKLDMITIYAPKGTKEELWELFPNMSMSKAILYLIELGKEKLKEI